MSYNASTDSHSNYPTMSQSQWDNAPFNKEEPEEKEFEVTVSITLSKTFKIHTDNYEENMDLPYVEGEPISVSYTPLDLEKEVKEQIILPQDAFKYINGNTKKGKQAIEDLKDWYVDDFCVNED